MSRARWNGVLLQHGPALEVLPGCREWPGVLYASYPGIAGRHPFSLLDYRLHDAYERRCREPIDRTPDL